MTVNHFCESIESIDFSSHEITKFLWEMPPKKMPKSTKKSEINENLSGLPWKKSFFWMSSRHRDDHADMMFIYQTTRSWRIPVTPWNPLFFILVQDSCHHWYQCINYHHVNLNMRDRHPHLVICWSPFRCAGSIPTRSTETKTVVTCGDHCWNPSNVGGVIARNGDGVVCTIFFLSMFW